MCYSQRLLEEEWKKYRGILLSEQTNCGGDQLVVYQKGEAFVRIHVRGCSSNLTKKSSLAQEWPQVYEIDFDFIHITPYEFFEDEICEIHEP